MDIFKLFFNHDQRLDKLAKRNANKTPAEIEATLDDFMKPTPTFSKFYITGTRLEEERFGLDTLLKFSDLIQQLNSVFSSRFVIGASGIYNHLSKALEAVDIGEALIISPKKETEIPFDTLQLDYESNVGHKKDELREILSRGAWLVYKEQAHHGFDLHLFSQENIYQDLFEAFKPLVDNRFRFFSINSKRMGSERHFYFETWTLDRPPHGAEEVVPETRI